MYDPRAKKHLRLVLFACAVLTVLGVTGCAAALLRKDRELLIVMAVFFGILLAVSLVMAALLWVMGRFRVAFSPTEIVYLWGSKAYRTVSYSAVEGVTICGAIDYYFFPIKGDNKKQLAMVLLLKNGHLGPRILPGGSIRFPCYRDSNVWCCCTLDRTDLETIMDGTQTTVFVTEDMLKLYAEELKPVFDRFPAERVMVSCRQADSRYPAWRTYREYTG